VVSDARLAAAGLLELTAAKTGRAHLEACTDRYAKWHERQRQLADPNYDSRGIVEKVRSTFDNPDERI
jgi:pyruvate dehydrogenase (quinone)